MTQSAHCFKSKGGYNSYYRLLKIPFLSTRVLFESKDNMLLKIYKRVLGTLYLSILPVESDIKQDRSLCLGVSSIGRWEKWWPKQLKRTITTWLTIMIYYTPRAWLGSSTCWYKWLVIRNVFQTYCRIKNEYCCKEPSLTYVHKNV